MFSTNFFKNNNPEPIPETHLERLKLHNVQTFWGMVLLAAALVVALWYGGARPVVLFSWLCILVATGIIRLGLNLQLKKAAFAHDGKNEWLTRYIGLTTLMSAIWGSAGVLMFPEAPVIQAALLIILIAVLIAASALLLASKTAFRAQFIAIMAPVFFSLLQLYTQTGYMILAVATVALSIMIIIASNYIHQVLTELGDTQTALQAQADTDQLTQIANRRSFDRAFKKEWRRSTRNQEALALVLIDIDNFKAYNDTFGHQAGDDTLRSIAGQVKRAAKRPGDLPVRLGGEEFALLLPDTDSAGAKTVAERLRKNIENLKINNPGAGNKILTVSMGISSCLPLHPDDKNEDRDTVFPAMLMKSADHALYEAKRNGKNAVSVEGCGMHSIPAPLKELEMEA